jgi:ferredoxin
MQELSERTGVPLLNFEGGSSVEMRGRLRSYMIARSVIDADVIVNVPKLKTHVLTTYTGCVKNMFGAVPGFAKGRLHSEAPRPVPFSRHIVDIYSLVRPSLNIMDAVVTMEGDGPSGGKPRRVGAILGGTDGVAVDAVAAMMIGLKEGAVPMLRQAQERGLGTAALSQIEIVGEAPHSFDTRGFALPRPGMLNLVPSFLVRALRPWIWVYPEMSKEWGCEAERCGLCVRSCPVSAIEMTETGPVVDRRACVECLCCHEVCPHGAVRVKLSRLAQRFA